MNAHQLADPPAEDGTLTVHCSCGNVWTYRRPRRYGGKAAYKKRCDKCGGTGIKEPTG